MRDDRKHREALREEDRKREFEEEKLKQEAEVSYDTIKVGVSHVVSRLQEEEERKRKEEQEKREEEEYLQLKESFVVEEEGLDGKDDETEVCVV